MGWINRHCPAVPTGYSIDALVDCKRLIAANGVVLDSIDPTATVQAQIVSSDFRTKLAPATTWVCDVGHPDADWANALIVVPITGAGTDVITNDADLGTNWIEISITQAGSGVHNVVYAPVLITRGNNP